MKQMKVDSKSDALVDLKNTIINQTYLAFSIMAVLAYTFTSIRAFENESFTSSYLIQTLMVAFLWLITVFRNKLNMHVKIFSFMLIILLVLTSGLYQYGFLASAKLYIPIVPVFVSFLYSYKASVSLLFVYILLFTVFAVLYINNILVHPPDISDYVTNPVSWSIDGSIILLVAWGLLYIGTSFQKSLKNNSYKIEKQNKQLIEYINMNSHEVRAPLASILGLLKVHALADDETEKKEVIYKIHESAENLDVVIKQMNRVLEVEILDDSLQEV